MQHPIHVTHLAKAIESDRRRAQRRPTAWTEASATLFRAPWADFSWRKLWDGIRIDARTVRQSGGEDQELPKASWQV